jgi:hypothetical protein
MSPLDFKTTQPTGCGYQKKTKNSLQAKACGYLNTKKRKSGSRKGKHPRLLN